MTTNVEPREKIVSQSAKEGRFTSFIRSLRSQLVVIVMIVSLLAALCFAFVTTFYTNAQLKNQHLANVERQLNGYSLITSRHLQAFDYVSVNNVMDYMIQSPEINAIRVVNAYDQLVSFNSDSTAKYAGITPDRILTMYSPDNPNQVVGRMSLWINFTPVSANLLELSEPLILFLLLFLVAVAAIIYRFIAISIVDPLKKVESNIVNFDGNQVQVIDESWYISKEIKSLQDRYVDMNARVQSQMLKLETLAERRQRFFSDSPALLLLMSSEGEIELASQEFLLFIGIKLDEIQGKRINDFLLTEYLDVWQSIIETQKRGKPTSSVTLEIHTRYRGARRIIYSSVLEAESEQYLAYINDITVEYKNRERLRELARTDELTNLSNRFDTENHILDLIKKHTPSQKPFALLFIDLDNFKRINDVYGHSVGDHALVNMAMTLKNTLSKNCHIGRFGGDEFVVVIPNIEEVNSIIDSLYAALKKPFHHKDQNFYLATSVGVARWPQDGVTPELLLRNADLALYQAKRAGRNQSMDYISHFEIEANRWLEAGDMVRKALLDGSFTYHWQAIHNRKNEIVWYELLLRLNGSNNKVIYPGDFIEIAEETGLMGNIAEFTTSFVSEIINQPNLKNVKLTVNLSRSQLLLNDLDKIIEPLVPHNEQIIFEVTEDAFLGGSDTLIALKRLDELGFSLALDDFGTGYSSLSLLTDLPVHIVKLDKQLLDQVLIKPESKSLYDSIVRMVHSLGKVVVAEGIETKEHQDFTMATGCDYFQGYFHHRPSPVLRMMPYDGISESEAHKIIINQQKLADNQAEKISSES